MVPVSRALSTALGAEYEARREGAARAVEGEYRRLAAQAASAAREVAGDPEVLALARARAEPGFDPAEAARLAPALMRARGLEVLALTGQGAVVLSSGHLPARAGEADRELAALHEAVPRGQAAPRQLSRATPEGVDLVLALVAWEDVPDDVPGEAPPLRVTAGIALGDELARRLAALTGGEVEVGAAGHPHPLARASPQRGALALAERLLGTTRTRTRRVSLPPEGPRAAVISVTLPAGGLAGAQVAVAFTLVAALALSAAAAALAGHLLARRITRPLEALGEGARRVRGGDLAARVEVAATGEVGELVEGFNAMTAELRSTTARAAAAERVAAWREVARRLAHEVKNPLTPVAMSVETLREAWARRRPDFGELFEEGTRAISEEVRRLVRIVDAFSRFARLPEPMRLPVPAAELLCAALALYPEAEGEPRVVRALAPDLPRGGGRPRPGPAGAAELAGERARGAGAARPGDGEGGGAAARGRPARVG